MYIILGYFSLKNIVLSLKDGLRPSISKQYAL